jgi:hypothetical protein
MTAPAPSLPATTVVPTADPLAGLKDWHLPDPVSWWPPAPGWWLLAAVAAGVLLWAVYRWHARRRSSAAGRAALARLAELRSELAPETDARRLAAELSILLRRLALVRYPRERVAGVSGSAWLRFLDATGGNGGFSLGAGRILTEAPYRSPHAGSAADLAELIALAERWIRANREPHPVRLASGAVASAREESLV